MENFSILFKEKTLEHGHKKRYIINQFNQYILPKLYKNIKINKCLEIIIDNFESDLSIEDKNILKNKIINHTNRVYKNMKIIINNLELRNCIFLSDYEIFILNTACLLHDIGKVYKNKNHNLYSAFIAEYLLSTDGRFDKNTINDILEIIYYHNKKDKNKSDVNILIKILRDADLFDENCGDSLLYLVISHIKNKDDDLNNLNVKKAKILLRQKMSDENRKEIESKINTPGGKELYRHLLDETIEKFYMYIDYIEEYEESEDYYNMKYIDCLRINIEK